MKKDLLALAQSDLAKRCKPQYQIEIDAVNFPAIPEFKEYTDQLELGNIITLDFGDNVLVESRILKIHMNWDNLADFSLTISSKNRLDGVFEQFVELQSQANGVSTAYNISGTGWNTAKNKTSTFSEYMSSTLNLAKQKLMNSSNETFVADSTGTKWRKLIDGTDNYSPNQMWGVGNGLYLTRDSWQSVEMAVGEGTYNGQTMYGVWAPLICGDLLLGQNLAILNSSGNFTINNDGFKATYGSNIVTINPNDPNNIFSINVGGTRKFYIDVVSNRLVFNGALQGATGTFSGALSAATGTFSGSLQAASGTFTGNLVAAGGTFSGTLQGVDGTFTGTLTGNTINGANINGGTINGTSIISTSPSYSTSISGGQINSTYVNCTFENRGGILSPNGLVLKGGAMVLIDGQAPSMPGHTHNSSQIIAIDSSDGYIVFDGAKAAGYEYVNRTFQKIGSSDFRLKKNIRSLEELPIELFMELKPKMYEMKCSL